MWKYGRKVIESLLKRRTERPAIRAEFASRSEADSDRSDIRVFEAGLSAEQYGDYQQSTGNASQEKEGDRLIAILRFANITKSAPRLACLRAESI